MTSAARTGLISGSMLAAARRLTERNCLAQHFEHAKRKYTLCGLGRHCALGLGGVMCRV